MQVLKAYLAPDLARVERVINDALRSDVALLDATNRSLREAPGKMMRPSLALLCAEAVGTVNEDTIRFAAAAELLHNATLLHDDVVDGATQRRGIPTVASLLGGSAAVLIGDYWLVKCIQTILGSSRYSERAVRIFASTLSHLAEGELLQMEKASKGDTSEADYIRIIYSKTASLFEASALSAAVSVSASPEQETAIGDFARNLGIAFQIMDDWMDYASSQASIGKPIGIDLKEQKITQPLLSALEEVPEADAALVRKKVASITDHPEYVDEVIEFVKEHGGVEKSALKAAEYIEKAMVCLDSIPAGEARERLKRLAMFVLERDK